MRRTQGGSKYEMVKNRYNDLGIDTNIISGIYNDSNDYTSF